MRHDTVVISSLEIHYTNTLHLYLKAIMITENKNRFNSALLSRCYYLVSHFPQSKS